MMALIPRVADGQKGFTSDLPLDGEHVVLRIRDGVAVVKERVRTNWDHEAKVESGIRMLCGHVVRWKCKRKWIGILRTVPGIGERSCEQRRSGAQVVISVRRNAVHDSGAEPGERGVEDAVAGADAAFSSVAEDLPEKFIFEMWRIGQANPRGKVAVLGR